MDKYIILSFQSDYLVLNQTNKLLSPEDIVNSNKLFHDQYIYTYKCFKKNDTDISEFVSKEIHKRKLTSIYFEDYRLTDLILDFIKIINIKSIYIKNFKALTLSQCNAILLNKYVKYLNCYFVPNAYIDKFKKANKKIHINYMDSISDEFLNNQKIKDENELYYKKSLNIYKNTLDKLKDIQEFFNINKNLKIIHIYECGKKTVDTILYYLRKDDIKNVTILLYQGRNGYIEENFKYLKEINKTFKKDLDGEMKIIYSEKYLKNNLFKQLNYNSLRMAIIILLYIAFIAILFTSFYSYVTNVNVEKLKYQMYLETLNSSSSNVLENSNTDENSGLEKSFINLIKINDDTVGWLTVNNTNINYPIVQADDNEYYLKRDFYKSKTSSGWVFMDYRNNAIVLDDNTIIYGHKLKNGLMFGSLSDVLKSSWYKDSENQIITFDILSTNIKWQIFSIYKTSYTTEYLKTSFMTAESYNEFVEEIQEKSIYDFNQELEYGDKILTLSTCTGFSSSNQRLVVHAKLIK